jgi:hypothetical protein
LSCEKVIRGLIDGEFTGGFLITKIDSAENPSLELGLAGAG